MPVCFNNSKVHSNVRSPAQLEYKYFNLDF